VGAPASRSRFTFHDMKPTKVKAVMQSPKINKNESKKV
jgi:hypothetical protein